MTQHLAKGEIFYKAKEVAEMLQISLPTLYKEINRGHIKATKIGKDYRISSYELRKLR